jgi:hypothetical protein
MVGCRQDVPASNQPALTWELTGGSAEATPAQRDGAPTAYAQGSGEEV